MMTAPAKRLTAAPGTILIRAGRDGRRMMLQSARGRRSKAVGPPMDRYLQYGGRLRCRRHTDCRAVCTYPCPP
jgi:hypothetical protein